MPNRPDLWRPSLVSGAIFGFLSGVPFVGALNCLCCSLILGAGIVSSWMLVKASTDPVTYGRSALAGLLSGLVAAPVSQVASLFFSVLSGSDMGERFAEGIERAGEFSPEAGEASRMLMSIPWPVLMAAMTVVLLFIFAPFGALGGVIGRAIFERRTPAPPAAAGPAPYQPPPSYPPPSFPPPPADPGQGTA